MNIAQIIDHTILRPDCTEADIRAHCTEAIQYGFAAVCVPPCYVKVAKKILKKSKVKIATVVGFPMGYSTIPAKVEEIRRAIGDGADELDIVVNIAMVKSGDWAYMKNDIESTTRITQLKDRTAKLILETGLMTEEEIIKLCEICTTVGADYVKTSTGFHGTGATVEAITLMRKHLPKKIKIKASGGIRTAEDAQKMILAGADRLGCSASIQIVGRETQ